MANSGAAFSLQFISFIFDNLLDIYSILVLYRKNQMLGIIMKKRKSQIPYIVAILLVVLLCGLCSRFCFQLTLLQGESMEPSYHSGQLLLLNKLDKTYERGSVILFYSETLERSLIKRICALPGDTVQIKTGRLFVNGEPYSPYPSCPEFADPGLAVQELIIPEDHCFVLGDNFSHSIDSRHSEVGLVRFEDIRGKII